MAGKTFEDEMNTMQSGRTFDPTVRDTLFRVKDPGRPALPSGGPTELQGTWRTQGAVRGGQIYPNPTGNHLTVQGHHFELTRHGSLLYGGTFSLDPSGQQKRIDLDQFQAGAKYGLWKGIYDLKGPDLTVCVNANSLDAPRPTDFRAGLLDAYTTIHLRRIA